MARCLLIQSGLPSIYWAETINTACYLRNRCPSSSHEGVTPHEIWHGRKPNLKHLRVFGAKAFILDKGPGRSKFDDRAIEGKLVGYADSAKTDKILRNGNGKIVITSHVNCGR